MTSLSAASAPKAFVRWESRSQFSRIYAGAPWWVQNLLMSAYGVVLQRQVDSPAMRREVRELMRTQYLSPDELAALQATKLAALLEHAYANVPYYRRVFDEQGLQPRDIRSAADLRRLPLLTKRDVREHWREMLATNVDVRKLVYRPTSGTTGSPLPVYLSPRDELTERAHWLRMREWAGWRPGDTRATFSGFPVLPPGPAHAPFWRHDFPERRVFFSVYHMTRENMPLYADKLREFAPAAIEGYPSYLSFLAGYLQKTGQFLPVRAIFTFSETLFPHQRAIIEERFACKITDWYGLTERAVSAGECERRDGYHLSAEKVIAEVVTSEGEPAEPGVYGELVGTNLDEYAMPLIRYRTGDMSALRPTACPCGRSLPLIEQIQTRVDHIITTPDGRLINPAPLAGLFRNGKIDRGRIVQETLDRVVIQIVASPDYTLAEAEPIQRGVQQVLGPEVNVSVELKDEISCTKTGKYPFVVSHVPVRV